MILHTYVADPAAARLRDRAHRLRVAAAEAARIADDARAVGRLADRVTWVGPAAERFTERVGLHAASVDHLADLLRDAARRLDALANAMATG